MPRWGMRRRAGRREKSGNGGDVRSGRGQMDETLKKLLTPAEAEVPVRKEYETRATLRPVDAAAGEIELTTPSGTTRYTLKPLGELYGKGPGTGSVDPNNDEYMPLFLGIEDAITRFYEAD